MDGVGRRSLTRLFRGTYGHWTVSYGLETSKNVLKAKGGGKTRSFGIVMGLTSVRKDDFLETRRGRIQRDGRCEFDVNNFALRWCKRPGYSRSYTGLNAIVRITRWFDHRSSSSSLRPFLEMFPFFRLSRFHDLRALPYVRLNCNQRWMENELNEVRVFRENFYFDLISSKPRKTTFLKIFELFTFEHFGEFSSIFVLILLKKLSSFDASSVLSTIAITSMPSALRID